MILFPMRVNVNLKNMTVEQVLQRRRDMHLAMTKVARLRPEPHIRLWNIA